MKISGQNTTSPTRKKKRGKYCKRYPWSPILALNPFQIPNKKKKRMQITYIYKFALFSECSTLGLRLQYRKNYDAR